MSFLSEFAHDELVAKIRMMVAKKECLHFLLVGRTGVGKSSTINSLFGEEVAPVGRYRPRTKDVKAYEHTHDGVRYKIFDTPGLCDDLPEAGNDDLYLAQIREVIEVVDSVLFVTKLNEERVRSDEQLGIRMISQALGPGIWSTAVIVFTNADAADARMFDADLEERTSLIRDEIAKYAPEHAKRIPAVAVSNTKEQLPNGKPWLGELFTQVFTRVSDEAALPFFLSMKTDIGAQRKGSDQSENGKEEKPRIELSDAQKEKVKNSLFSRIVTGVTTGAGLGAKIGDKVGGKIGAAIGMAIGAVIGGALGWLF